jgi:DNA-binding Lrp family transcriptional regulator
MEEAYRKLLNIIQDSFPITERPFKELGEKAGLTEEEVITFLQKLQKEGILRHLGASPDSHKLGHFTCLCACHLPEDKLHLAEEIADLPEVTHAYLREHFLNFWFTLVLPSKEALEPYLRKLQEKYHLEIKAFPATRKFKVRAVFTV